MNDEHVSFRVVSCLFVDRCRPRRFLIRANFFKERNRMLQLFVRIERRLAFPCAGLLIFTLSAFILRAAPQRRTDIRTGARAAAAQTTPAPTDATATIYGVKIHYVEAGSGP